MRVVDQVYSYLQQGEGRSAGPLGGVAHRLRLAFRRHRGFYLVVVLPFLLCALYLWGYAADQYVSEARFVVRQNSQTVGASSLLGIFGTTASELAQSDAYAIADYLQSHDAVRELRKRMDLVAMYRRSEADLVSELWWSQPSDEELLDYFNRMVDVSFDAQSGSARLRVYAFRPDDARQIATALLELGESRVNAMSLRGEEDTIRVAQQAVSRAEDRVARSQAAVTRFRTQNNLVDPTKSVTTVMTVVGTLEQQLASANALLDSERRYLSPSSPQFQLLSSRIASLRSQIASENGRLAGNQSTTLAPILAGYERLGLEQDFASKGYASALASLEAARLEAMKQHLFVARIVEPNLPEESTYPRRFTITLTLFFSLLLIYAIGWLLLAGAREHAA